MGTRITGRATFGGLASGFDTNALIDGLMQIERQPLQRIQSRRGEVDAQRNLVRQLNSKLLALRNAARDLDNRNSNLTNSAVGEEFLKYKATTTNADVVEVTAGRGAAPGDVQIRVEELARGSRRFSTVFTASEVDEAIALQANQTLTIRLPNGDPDADPVVEPTEIVISAGASAIDLASLRDQINGSEDNDAKVRADILQVSEGRFQLVLASTEEGLENELDVSGDIAFLAPNPDGSDNARSAVFHLFGQRVERPTNTIDDALAGMTFKLKAKAELDENDQPITETVSVQTDIDAIAKGLQTFIDAYNDVVSFIDSQSKYDETRKASGPLSGDSMIREVQRRLREAVSLGYKFEDNPNNPFAPGGTDAQGRPASGGSISGVGIEIAGDGKLKLDRERLEEALGQNALMVVEFLSGRERRTVANQDAIDRANAYNASLGPNPDPDDLREVPEPDLWDEGFLTNVGLQLESIVRSGDGLLAERDRQFVRRLDQFDDSIDQFNARLERREELLIQRFTALERIVASLQNQQGFLGGLR